jgi:hypothetical protein
MSKKQLQERSNKDAFSLLDKMLKKTINRSDASVKINNSTIIESTPINDRATKPKLNRQSKINK